MNKHFKVEAGCTLILANGRAPEHSLLKYYRDLAHTFIALDGAANWAVNNQLPPDLVVGDLDSIDADIIKSLPFVHLRDQETNDLAKALNYCQQKKLNKIVVLGAYGIRSDHFLTNIFAIKNFAAFLNIILIDKSELAFICPAEEEILIENKVGSYLSLFPLGDSVGPITLNGVDYPLNEEILSLNNRIGTLNKINSPRASLRCQSENLLVFLPNDLHRT